MERIKPRNWIRWDGSRKDYTKDCIGCEFYREIKNKKLCGWGVAFKYLIEVTNLRRCNLLRRELSQNQSIKYLDEIILENQNDHDKLD